MIAEFGDTAGCLCPDDCCLGDHDRTQALSRVLATRQVRRLMPTYERDLCPCRHSMNCPCCRVWNQVARAACWQHLMYLLGCLHVHGTPVESHHQVAVLASRRPLAFYYVMTTSTRPGRPVHCNDVAGTCHSGAALWWPSYMPRCSWCESVRCCLQRRCSLSTALSQEPDCQCPMNAVDMQLRYFRWIHVLPSSGSSVAGDRCELKSVSRYKAN